MDEAITAFLVALLVRHIYEAETSEVQQEEVLG